MRRLLSESIVAPLVGCGSVLVMAALLAGCKDSGMQPIDARVVDGQPDDGAPTDGGPDALVIDAPPDAATAVQVVDCAGATIAQTVINAGFTYSPAAATIDVDDIIQFDLNTGHDVVPDATGSDPGLRVPSGGTRCLRFTTAGTFGYHCGPHGFQGSVTVQ